MILRLLSFLFILLVSKSLDFTFFINLPLFFTFFIILNYFISFKSFDNKLNFDVYLRFFILCIKTPNLFFNYLITFFKKIFVFLIFFKNLNVFTFLFIYLKSLFNNFFLLWKPLFKKTSYFGYFRSNRSKWIK